MRRSIKILLPALLLLTSAGTSFAYDPPGRKSAFDMEFKDEAGRNIGLSWQQGVPRRADLLTNSRQDPRARRFNLHDQTFILPGGTVIQPGDPRYTSEIVLASEQIERALHEPNLTRTQIEKLRFLRKVLFAIGPAKRSTLPAGPVGSL